MNFVKVCVNIPQFLLVLLILKRGRYSVLKQYRNCDIFYKGERPVTFSSPIYLFN
jgi:hypothetical protein